MTKLLYDHDDHARKKRINKEVEITLHHGDFEYLYLEFSNGQRIKLIRPVIKK